jgi:hypothetical protein
MSCGHDTAVGDDFLSLFDKKKSSHKDVSGFE